MAAYLIFIREGAVRDTAEFAEYSKLARSAGGDIKATPLVAYGAVTPLEGEPADGMVVMQFDNAEDAQRWYDRPGYQDAIPHRMKAADYRVMLVQGLG